MQVNAVPDSPRDAGRLGVVRPREYITFRLGAEEYGIDILKVQEIRGYEQPTRIAHAPPFIKGVINLRGVIVPIVDLRIRFGLGEPRYGGTTVTVILNVGGRVVGVVVDSVSDVLELPADAMRDAPDLGATDDAACILGLGVVGERMLILLDIERLVLAADMAIAN